MSKSIEEINQKIKSGKAVVLTAEEFKKLGEKESPASLVKKVDVVTTATFGPMCSSGAFINFGHASPGIRMEKISLNGVPAYGGIAAVDTYIGATETAYPTDEYGGAHVIEDLVSGKEVRLRASGKGTDCYPAREADVMVSLKDINEAFLFNPRNAYQNYGAAINSSKEKKYTYMGVLLPRFGNINYSTSGELSPLLNDPWLRFTGIGTRIFLCGATGYVAWSGTQCHLNRERNERGIPLHPAATLAVTGNLKEMSAEYLRAACFEKYGVSLFVGIGIPYPVIDADAAMDLLIRNRDIETRINDYGTDNHDYIETVNYDQLQRGEIELCGKTIRTAPLSSISKARQIAEELKHRILKGRFFLTQKLQDLPGSENLKSLSTKKGGVK
ncbi:MAG TPA: homocysteine biosynthesis protein [Bacteroidales bacterium]|nr:homocysteine biosynthesis protein [Bacteroidales bacterium]